MGLGDYPLGFWGAGTRELGAWGLWVFGGWDKGTWGLGVGLGDYPLGFWWLARELGV